MEALPGGMALTFVPLQSWLILVFGVDDDKDQSFDQQTNQVSKYLCHIPHVNRR